MEPREKAQELVDKMYYCQRYVDSNHLHYIDGENYIPIEAYKRAKQCALIAVDEIILAIPDASDDDSPYNHELKYWQEVKEEILNINL